MTKKTITIKIEAEIGEIIDSALDSYCRQTGWLEESGVEQLQHARNMVRQHFISTITLFNICSAQLSAEQQARQQTEGALDLTTLTVSVI